VFCALHDQLASLGRHAQLTRCFSAVAELLVPSGAFSGPSHEHIKSKTHWYFFLLILVDLSEDWAWCCSSVHPVVNTPLLITDTNEDYQSTPSPWFRGQQNYVHISFLNFLIFSLPVLPWFGAVG